MPTRANRPLIWDMVVPLAPSVGNDIALLDRFHASGHSFVSLTIAGDDCGLAEAMHRLTSARAGIAARPDRLLLATSVADVRRAHAEGLLAVGLHLEGTECLERDVDMIDTMYALGIRHAILAFNQNNSASGGCADVGNVGLSRLGRRYLDRMRQAGMLLDVSHMSAAAAFEAIEHLGVPVVATHSNAAALFPHYRNLSDELVDAIAESGGLVGISGSSMYLGRDGTLAEVAFRHIDYLVQRVGAAHVGIGTDYIVDTDAVARLLSARPDEWPDGDWTDVKIDCLPPEQLADVIGLTARAGYGEPAIGDILGGNYLRIAEAVWR